MSSFIWMSPRPAVNPPRCATVDRAKRKVLSAPMSQGAVTEPEMAAKLWPEFRTIVCTRSVLAMLAVSASFE